LSYGWTGDWDYWADDVELLGPEGSSFTLHGPRGLTGKIKLNLLGKHNILNAVGASAMALEGGVSLEAIQKALANFEGASRRFEVKVQHNGFTLVDDYAHHPVEIEMTLQAARSYTSKRVVAVFQPHRYSRVEKLKKEFSAAFGLAHEVVVTDIYAASEAPIEGISGEALAGSIRNQHTGEVSFIPRKNLVDALINKETQDTLWILMGAGDISQAAEELKEAYEKKLS